MAEIGPVKCRLAGIWLLLSLLLWSTAVLVKTILEAASPQIDFTRQRLEQGAVQISEDSDEINDDTHVNLGVMSQGETIQHVFAIRNKTSNPLTVVSVQRSCGCQTHDLVEGTIIPAGKVLMFSFGTTSLSVGHRLARLVIVTDSDDPSLEQITLTLEADVQAAGTTHWLGTLH